jgi:hypothetical protein
MSDTEASRLRSGLSSVDWDKLTALIKAKVAELPERSSIPDEPTLTIELNGVIVSKYCRHCSRYTKSSGMHSSTEHKGKNKFPYVAPVASAPAAAPAAAPEITGPPPVAASLAQVSPPVTPSPEVTFAPLAGQMFRSVPQTTYDFGNMSTREGGSAGGFIAAVPDSNREPDPFPNSFLSFLGGTPDPSIKDQGR